MKQSSLASLYQDESNLSRPRRHALAAALLGLPCAAIAGAAQEVSTSDASLPPPEAVTSLYWGDFDSDGLDDVWFVGHDGSGRLAQNNGLGGFLDVTDRVGLRDVERCYLALFEDVDRDGNVDLFLPSWDGRSRLMRQTSSGMFEDVTETAGLPVGGELLHAEFLDFDGDGAMDLHLMTLQEDLLFRNTGRGTFEEVSLGAVPRRRPAPIAGSTPLSLDSARAQRGLPGTAAAGSGAAVITSRPGGPAAEAGGLSCALRIQDVATGGCLMASSVPQIGLLYPISTELYVDGVTGFVGMGTTTPTSPLTVMGDIAGRRLLSSVGMGTPPMSIASSTLVNLLNADFIDGLSSEDFRLNGDLIASEDIEDNSIGFRDIGADAVRSSELAPDSVTSVHIVDGSISASDIGANAIGPSELADNSVDAGAIVDGAIFDADVNANAAVLGTKIDPNFGEQLVTGMDGATFRDFERTAVKGTIDIPVTSGYLAVQGLQDFDGTLTADWNGLEIGVAGVSTGSTSNDNYGVMGHSNHVAVRGEHSATPSVDFGELGLAGVGVHGSGTTSGGTFFSTSGTTIVADRADNGGNIIECTNSTDIEFRVESNGSVFCDGTFNGGGADYAEWLPLLDASESVSPGDVVGVFAGHITRNVVGADQVLVISTNPCLVGNGLDAETGDRVAHERVAFIGQVPVKVRGVCDEGDFLVPSGKNDGVAVAVDPGELTADQVSLVLGVAWGSSKDRGVKKVNAAVGVDQAAAAAVALERVHDRLEAMEARMAALFERLEALEQR